MTESGAGRCTRDGFQIGVTPSASHSIHTSACIAHIAPYAFIHSRSSAPQRGPPTAGRPLRPLPMTFPPIAWILSHASAASWSFMAFVAARRTTVWNFAEMAASAVCATLGLGLISGSSAEVHSPVVASQADDDDLLDTRVAEELDNGLLGCLVELGGGVGGVEAVSEVPIERRVRLDALVPSLWSAVHHIHPTFLTSLYLSPQGLRASWSSGLISVPWVFWTQWSGQSFCSYSIPRASVSSRSVYFLWPG